MWRCWVVKQERLVIAGLNFGIVGAVRHQFDPETANFRLNERDHPIDACFPFGDGFAGAMKIHDRQIPERSEERR